MKIVLGLAGKAEHGKSAASRIIREHVFANGGVAGIFELSHYIYLSCVRKGLLPDGLDRAKMTNAHIKVLVDEGNAGRRENPMTWTNQVMAAMDASACDVVICPNVRFQTEIDGVHKLGGYNIRVNRLNRDGSSFVSTTRDPNDITETAIDFATYDYYLYNMTGHGALLEQQVITLFEYIAALEESK